MLAVAGGILIAVAVLGCAWWGCTLIEADRPGAAGAVFIGLVAFVVFVIF